KARLAVGAKVADRLVEAHQALLDEVVRVPAGQEVRRGLQPHEAVIAPHEPVVGVAVAELGERDQKAVIDLRFRLRVTGDSCHELVLSSGRPRSEQQKKIAQWRTPPPAPKAS